MSIWRHLPDTSHSQMLRAVLALVLIMVAFAISLVIRTDMFLERSGAQGVEATYHVIWTAVALNASAPAAHFYLPTVTLSPTPGNTITWGATVPTPGGAYIYTSFPPLGFLVPAVALNAVSAHDSFITLALLNSLVGLVAALLMGGLTRAVVMSLGEAHQNANRDGWMVFALSGILYLFTREALISHGPVVWPHSLSQLCLIAGCWLALNVFTQRTSYLTVAGLTVVALLYPSLEWTGFVFNAGLLAALLYDALLLRRQNASLVSAIAITGATLVAGAGIIIHFSTAIGTDALLWSLTSRAQARGYNSFAFLKLPLGYLVSFGALIPATLLAIAYTWLSFRTFRARAIWLTLFASSFPMVENLVMMQHAEQFSFDRLKLAVPLLLICSLALWNSRMVSRRPYLLGCLVMAVLWSNLSILKNDIRYYRRWGSIHEFNSRIVNQLAGASECRTIGTNVYVRGYMNLAFGRDIRERISAEQLIQQMVSDGSSCAIHVRAKTTEFPDLPQFIAIEVFDRDGKLLRLHDGTCEK